MVRNNRLPPSDLRRVIEPLASYICAADQPKAVLNLVYSALFNEVARVHRAAREQVAAFGRGPVNRVARLVRE